MWTILLGNTLKFVLSKVYTFLTFQRRIRMVSLVADKVHAGKYTSHGHRPEIVKRAVIGSKGGDWLKRWMEAQHNI